MQVNLYATFRLLAGVKTITLELPPGASVRAAIDAAVHKVPVLRAHWLDADSELHAHVHVFLNGEDVSTLPDGLLTSLGGDDVLDFFPPVAGG